jgi:phosphatidylserine/phosphatidylglycerophosphate/cardiolipin synthase-like enzyme
MPEEPRYWGSWKGRVVKAIAVDGARTWTEIRDGTGLSPKSLNRVLAELFDAKMLEKRGESEYRVAYELYKTYQEYFDEQKGIEQPVLVRISEGEQKDLIGWIDDWKKVKRLDFSLKPDHFFLEGRFLDDFSKEIIANSKREVLVVNPFVDKCDLSDTLRDAASEGRTVMLITRPPDAEKNAYHNTLMDAGVKIFHNKSTHAKIVVVDRAVATVSSMNFYAASSGGKSWEAGLVTIEETVVEAVINSILTLVEKPESVEMS